MKDGKFEVGDRVRVDTDSWGILQAGNKGTVYERSAQWVRVRFDEGSYQKGNSYHDGDLSLLPPLKKAAPSIAKDIKLTPQARTVLKHLERRLRISPSEALITYSISRLASCIHEIRRAGYNVTTKVKEDEHGHKYARYTLVKKLVH